VHRGKILEQLRRDDEAGGAEGAGGAGDLGDLISFNLKDGQSACRLMMGL